MPPYRLARLFHATSGRCLNVAVDHGVFGEPAFLTGIEDMVGTVDTLVAAGPDAIQLALGQAPLLQARPGSAKPALVLRTDVANVYGGDVPARSFSRMLDHSVEHAVRLDAACIVVNLFDAPGQSELRQACVANIMAVKARCDELGMPLMVEPLVLKVGPTGGYVADGRLDRIMALVRQATELGADVIKADPTDDLDAYHQVVQVARVPLLVRGGGRVPDRELLARTEAVLAQGAAGIVYGRNIIQHPRPAAIVAALLAILHRGSTAAAALARLEDGTP